MDKPKSSIDLASNWYREHFSRWCHGVLKKQIFKSQPCVGKSGERLLEVKTLVKKNLFAERENMRGE